MDGIENVGANRSAELLTVTFDGIKGKILTMLGNGLSNEIVSTAVGVSPSYISQLLSEEAFAMQVTELRFQNLQKHTERDNSYDSIEDALIEKMRDLLPMMYRPMEVLRAIQVINAAKRRGASAPEQMTINNTVINLNLPKHQMQKIIQNSQGQVVQAGNQVLLTMSSNSLLNTIAQKTEPKTQQLKLESTTQLTDAELFAESIENSNDLRITNRDEAGKESRTEAS